MPKTILVVDDSASIRNILLLTLKFKGYEVREAADGRQAFEIFQQQHVDVVITDIAMPHMTGLELLQKIRSESSRPQTPVILCTAEDIGSGEEYLKLGANHLIKKPLSPKELLDIVEEQCR